MLETRRKKKVPNRPSANCNTNEKKTKTGWVEDNTYSGQATQDQTHSVLYMAKSDECDRTCLSESFARYIAGRSGRGWAADSHLKGAPHLLPAAGARTVRVGGRMNGGVSLEVWGLPIEGHGRGSQRQPSSGPRIGLHLDVWTLEIRGTVPVPTGHDMDGHDHEPKPPVSRSICSHVLNRDVGKFTLVISLRCRFIFLGLACIHQFKDPIDQVL